MIYYYVCYFSQYSFAPWNQQGWACRCRLRPYGDATTASGDLAHGEHASQSVMRRDMESRTFAPRSLPDGRGGLLQLMVVADSGSSAPNRSRRLRPWVIGRAYGIGGEGSCRGWCGKPLPGARGVRGRDGFALLWTDSPDRPTPLPDVRHGAEDVSAARARPAAGRSAGPSASATPSPGAAFVRFGSLQPLRLIVS